MAPKKKTKLKLIYALAGFVAVALLVLALWLVNSLLNFDKNAMPERIHQITLMKPPPPPPPPEEEPPEPEIEEVIEEVPEDVSEDQADEAQDSGPDLGIDAEGVAGGDSFGLVGKKGGTAIIGGEGSGSLLRKYAWYNQIVQKELSDEIRKILEDEQGIPKGKLQAIVRVILDSQGNIVDFKIINPSGNKHLDKTIQQVLNAFRISEPPPEGMPLTADVRLISQG